MTPDHDIERVLEHWLTDGVNEMPGRVYQSIFDRVDRQPQAIAPRLLRRLPVMNHTVRLIAAAAAVLLIGVLGFAVAGRPPDPPVAPSPSPTPESRSIPDALRSLWIGETRLIPELSATQDRSFLDLGAPVAGYNTGPGGIALRSTVEAEGPDRLAFTSADVSFPCDMGDVGTYAWSLSPGGTTLTLTADGADACDVRAMALPGSWTRSTCPNPDNACLGDIEPGTYRTTFFEPFGQPEGSSADWRMQYGQVSYTVPEGWAATADWLSGYDLVPQADVLGQTGDGPFHWITLLGNPEVSSQDAACSAVAEPGVGHRAGEIASRIAQIPGLVASEPTPITIDGRTGMMLDVSLSTTWDQTCPEMNGVPTVPLIREMDSGSDHWDWRLYAPLQLRLILLDLDADTTMAIVVVDSSEPSRFDELVARAMPIIESLKFHPPAPVD